LRALGDSGRARGVEGRKDGAVTELDMHARRAASFDSAAERYESARPGYPAQAVAWMVPESAASVLDLGAGTGKLTESLVAPGRIVYAVDPSAEMLRVLARKLPEVDARLGSGERIPLPDASVDVVTIAQAWHWMDSDKAAAEIARVLRPGGLLSMVWNNDDDRVAWVRELGGAADAAPQVGPVADEQLDVLPGFAPGSAYGWQWLRRMTRRALVAQESSVSNFLIATPAAQAERIEYLHAVLDRHPELERGGAIDYPMYTLCFRYRRLR
jgi:ubiquinone/menaquinone biosynthesis C-methylase UbiE